MTTNTEHHPPRIKVSQPAVLRNGGAPDIACTIIDVSLAGFRIQVPPGLTCGPKYTLEYADESHPVEIRWVVPGEAGGLFLDVESRA